MHSSAVVALAIVAAAAPAFGAPVHPALARRQPQSGAITTSEIGDIVKIGNDVITGFGDLKQIFSGSPKTGSGTSSRKRGEAVFARQASLTSSSAPAPTAAPTLDPLSAAISLSTIAKIGSGIDKALGGIESFFGSVILLDLAGALTEHDL